MLVRRACLRCLDNAADLGRELTSAFAAWRYVHLQAEHAVSIGRLLVTAPDGEGLGRLVGGFISIAAIHSTRGGQSQP